MIPFAKALLYIAVVECRIDFEQPQLLGFMRKLEEFFPFVILNAPLSEAKSALDKLSNIPATIVKGTWNKVAQLRFLKEAQLQELHDIFHSETFQDFLYDVDLRRKVDGMILAGFRYREIEEEIKITIPAFSAEMVKVYTDCFANFSEMTFDQKRNHIVSSLEDMSEQTTLLRCLENKSRDIVRTILGVRTKSHSPIDMVNRTAQIIALKTQEGLLGNDDDKLKTFLGLSLRVADALQKLGVGNKDAAEELLRVLDKRGEETSATKHLTVQDLEEMFRATNS